MQAEFTDKEQVKALWKKAFNEDDPFLSGYFDNFWAAENALVLKDRDLLYGALSMIPYSVSINKILTDCAYIVGVSIDEAYRGKKLSNVLMKDCIKEQKKRGMTLSLLIPFNYEFYNKLGYRLCYTLDVYETEADSLPCYEGALEISKASKDDIQKLNIVYNNFCTDKNGCNLRTEKDWEYIFFEQKLFNGGIFTAMENKKISGYASYLEKNGEIFVRELIYTDMDSLSCLLSKLKEYKKIKIRTFHSDLLLKILKNPKNCLKTVPTVMARVCNIEKILALFYADGLKIKITDNFIEENCGIYEKSGEIIKKIPDGDFNVSMDIGAFTQLALGFSDAKELAFTNQLIADTETIEKLSAIFPKQNNYINHIMEE